MYSRVSNPARDTHRDRLLLAARTLLREREYGKITARDLVAVSGTNLGSIGYHFGSKEALLNEAIGLALEEWADTIGQAITASAGKGVGALTMGSLGLVLDQYETIRPYYLAFIEALARSARSPVLREQLAAHYERQRQRIARWLTDAPDGVLTPEQARDIASLMLATADGMLIQAFIDRAATPSTSELAKAMTAVLGGDRPKSVGKRSF